MSENIKTGLAMTFGDNINTDIISPPQYMEYSLEESSHYAMSAVCPDFEEKVKTHKIMVAGKNFGSGSSRETSPLSLKYLGVEVIVAQFFARIFYRNCINVGLLVIECADTDRIHEDDNISVDYLNGKITNHTTGEEYPCSRIPDHLVKLIQDGGLVASLKKEWNQKNN